MITLPAVSRRLVLCVAFRSSNTLNGHPNVENGNDQPEYPPPAQTDIDQPLNGNPDTNTIPTTETMRTNPPISLAASSTLQSCQKRY
jgi:hypothetical protein